MYKKVVLVCLLIFGCISTLSAEIIENVQIRVGNRTLTYTLYDTLEEFNSQHHLLRFLDIAYYEQYVNKGRTGGVISPNNSLSPDVINTMKRYNKKFSYTHYQENGLDYYILNVRDNINGGDYYRTYIMNGI